MGWAISYYFIICKNKEEFRSYLQQFLSDINHILITIAPKYFTKKELKEAFNLLYKFFELANPVWIKYDKFLKKWQTRKIAKTEFMKKLIEITEEFLFEVKAGRMPGALTHNIYLFVEQAILEEKYKLPQEFYKFFESLDGGVSKDYAEELLIKLKKIKIIYN